MVSIALFAATGRRKRYSKRQVLSEWYPDAWTDEENQISADHYAYLKQALEDGVLILAGRSLDGIGPAVVVIEAETEEEARAFLLEDPFVKSALFGAELHPFRAALVRMP